MGTKENKMSIEDLLYTYKRHTMSEEDEIEFGRLHREHSKTFRNQPEGSRFPSTYDHTFAPTVYVSKESKKERMIEILSEAGEPLSERDISIRMGFHNSHPLRSLIPWLIREKVVMIGNQAELGTSSYGKKYVLCKELHECLS